MSPGAQVVTLHRTISHGIVSRHDAGCRRWRQTAYDLRLQPRTQLSGNHPAGSRRASVFPLASPCRRDLSSTEGKLHQAGKAYSSE